VPLHPPAPVAHLGIDERRRGKPRWTRCQETGEVRAGRRPLGHTCFFDLSGRQGLLEQVEGRTADDAAYWMAQATPAWRDKVRVAAIDMCSIYLSAVPHAPARQVAVDLLHVMHLAVKTTQLRSASLPPTTHDGQIASPEPATPQNNHYRAASWSPK
jgi:transposase